MPRHGDTRSPSPVGSSYSSKRNRRDDDRYDRVRRDDGRSHRRRSRTRSPDVRSLSLSYLSKAILMIYFREDTEIATHAHIEIVHEIAEMKTSIVRAEETGQEKGVDHEIGIL